MSAHVTSLRVRYCETDQMGVAHHASWIPWFEDARIAWLREHGASYKELEASGVLMPVIDLSVRYRRSALFDDVLELHTTIDIRPPSRVAFHTRVQRSDGTMLGEATVTVAAVDRSGKPMRLPAVLLDLHRTP